MTNTDQQIAQELAGKLRATASHSVKRIIFYGSRAAGRAIPESDFDFLVIEADPVSKREEGKILCQAVRNTAYPVNAWFMGEEEFEETRQVIGGLAYPANKYGLVLYETGGQHVGAY